MTVLLIETNLVSHIQSIFIISLKLFFFDRFLNFWKDPKYLDNNLAFSNPICLIPKE